MRSCDIEKLIEEKFLKSGIDAPHEFESPEAINRIKKALETQGWIVSVSGRQREDHASEFIVTLTREDHETVTYADMTLPLAMRWVALRTVGINETGRPLK